MATAILSVVSGFSISALGSYVEFAWAGTAILTIASGLIYTLDVGSNTGKWLGYQIIAGVGAGMALQTPFVAVQSGVRSEDVPLASTNAPSF